MVMALLLAMPRMSWIPSHRCVVCCSRITRVNGDVSDCCSSMGSEVRDVGGTCSIEVMDAMMSPMKALLLRE